LRNRLARITVLTGMEVSMDGQLYSENARIRVVAGGETGGLSGSQAAEQKRPAPWREQETGQSPLFHPAQSVPSDVDEKTSIQAGVSL
jgi:hypothetical protein